MGIVGRDAVGGERLLRIGVGETESAMRWAGGVGGQAVRRAMSSA